MSSNAVTYCCPICGYVDSDVVWRDGFWVYSTSDRVYPAYVSKEDFHLCCLRPSDTPVDSTDVIILHGHI